MSAFAFAENNSEYIFGKRGNNMLDISGFEKYESILRFFEEISAIPRGSGNTAPIADYLEAFASARGLECIRDTADNVVIRKPATQGFEGRPTIILQGHTDIVAEKTVDCKIDMERCGLDIYRDGNLLRARGTTLGADDGVAVAYALAALDGAADGHPALEAVFTSNEETGLFGAEALDGSMLRGRLLINIDSDREGIFTVGCAGGMQVAVTLPVGRETAGGKCYRLTVSGLLGGHSGVDINEGRENATRILGEALAKLPDVLIAELSGGTKDNAIPRSAECVFVAKEDISAGACQVFDALRAKYSTAEPSVCLELSEAESSVMPLDSISTERVIGLLTSLPTGIIKMSEELVGQVETSLNLGITELTEESLSLSFYLRSSREGATESLYEELAKIAGAYSASATINSSYPAWEYNPDSPLRETMVSLYRELYGSEPIVNTIHAGLECGILAAKVEVLDCISIGPDNFCLHTTEEHLSIPSFARVWDFLVMLMKRI